MDLRKWGLYSDIVDNCEDPPHEVIAHVYVAEEFYTYCSPRPLLCDMFVLDVFGWWEGDEMTGTREVLNDSLQECFRAEGVIAGLRVRDLFKLNGRTGEATFKEDLPFVRGSVRHELTEEDLEDYDTIYDYCHEIIGNDPNV